MASQPTTGPTHGQLIVTFKPEAKVTKGSQGLESPAVDVSSLQNIIDRHGASVNSLFGPVLDQPHDSALHVDDHHNLASFHHVHAAPEKLEQLASELLAHEHVDAAYIKPAGSPPIAHALVVTKVEPAAVTPSFVDKQIYRNAAPVGIDIVYAQTFLGGYGEDVKIVDCEWGWQFTHEDLKTNDKVVSQLITGENDLKDPDHGTAVVGVISGALNDYGITGLAPKASLSACAFPSDIDAAKTAPVILKAAGKLDPGDILLLEIHRPANLLQRPAESHSQWGYLPVEWWPDDLAAIQAVVKKGIIVVEAAGNGSQDLDLELYNSQPQFGTSWKNPLNPKNPSSGAILVGAGNPPPGTHGITVDPWTNKPYVDRARCKFSNWGSRVDCQGWGQRVTTIGYGDLQGGQSRDRHYAGDFSGTSSASPIIVGALAVIQGILKKAGKSLLTPKKAQEILRSTGSPQQDGPEAPKTQRIGNRPDLRQLLKAAGAV